MHERSSFCRLGIDGALDSMDTDELFDDKDLAAAQVTKKAEEKAEASRLLSQMQGAQPFSVLLVLLSLHAVQPLCTCKTSMSTSCHPQTEQIGQCQIEDMWLPPSRPAF